MDDRGACRDVKRRDDEDGEEEEEKEKEFTIKPSTIIYSLTFILFCPTLLCTFKSHLNHIGFLA